MNVLPGDMKLASKLHECCYSCLERARMELKLNDIDAAAKWVNEFQRCKRDLDELVKKKQWKDKIEKLAEELSSKGISISTIKKLTAANSSE